MMLRDELRTARIDIAAALLDGEPGDSIAQATMFKALVDLEPDILLML
jgi:hypothetical protein